MAILDLLQSGETTPLTAVEQQEWIRVAGWYKPYSVASICREDLRGIMSEDTIVALSDEQMQHIADKMSDAYRESGYWDSLAEATQSVTNTIPESATLSQPKDTPKP